MTAKRFRVTISNENSVSFIDTQQNKRFLYIKFHTEKDAIDCKNALMCQCNLLNELHEENQSSKEFIEQLQEELVLFKNAGADMGIDLNNQITALKKENEQLKKELKRCKDWINSDKYDYELTLAFIKNKGYSLKDVLEYEKELIE